MRDHGRRVKAAAIVASLAALVGACTDSGDDDDEPVTLPDITPSAAQTVDALPSAEPTPSPTPTTDPTAALEAEIVSFFEEYTRAIDGSWTSEDLLTQRRAMFSDSCVSCLAGYEFAERVHAEGLTFEGGLSTHSDTQVTDMTSTNATLLTTTDTPAGRLVRPDGSVEQEFDENLGKQILYQLARAEDGTWLIINSEVL